MSLNKDDRVRIIRKNFGHCDLACLVGAEGTISQIAEPWAGDRDMRRRYEVTFDKPLGARGYTAHFPLYDADLQSVTR